MPVQCAAMLLNLMVKEWKLPETRTSEEQLEWIQPTVDKMKAIWRQQHKPSGQHSITRVPLPGAAHTPSDRVRSAKRLRLHVQLPEVIYHLTAYFAIDQIAEDIDIIQYWTERQFMQPQFSTFSLDVFAIQIMSDRQRAPIPSG